MKHLMLALSIVFMVGCEASKDDGKAEVERYVNPVTDRSGALNEMAFLVNGHRTRLGLKPLALNTGMSLEAQLHTEDMAQGRMPFGHFNMSQRCLNSRRALSGGNACGEVVSRFYPNADGAFNGWLNSFNHRDQIEDRRFTHMGIGLAIDPGGMPYWTLLMLQKE